MDLDDVTVLDLTQLFPGPLCTQYLADLGADVVKIEPPDGDPARDLDNRDRPAGVFRALNRGKRSVSLNLTRDADRIAFRDLAADADVVVEGFRPGTVERLGADYATVRERNPEVVYLSLTAFGQDGPDSDRPAHDLTLAGRAGLLDLSRHSRDERPVVSGGNAADVTGALVAAVSILAGLLARELGGGGTYVDASLFEATMGLTRNILPAVLAGKDPRPNETAFGGRDPWYDVYEAADGRYLTVAAAEEPFWHALCEAINRPELVDAHGIDDPAVRAAVREALAATFRERSRDEWLDNLPAETVVGPVNTLGETLEDPQIEARNFVCSSAIPHIGYPTLFVDGNDRHRPDVGEEVPEIGEHTASVLRAADVDEDTIDAITKE